MKEIQTPTIVLNWETAGRNLRQMLDKATQNGLLLRPHFKTPQSIDIGRKCREMGIRAITVSSFRMAEYFASDGWSDITVAFPVNGREVGKIYRLSRKTTLNLLVVNPESIDFLNEPFPQQVGIFIKIDVGTHRTGLSPNDDASIGRCLEKTAAAPSLTFRGFLAHAGHSYRARSKKEILEVHRHSIGILKKIKKKYVKKYPGLILSTGDTPTCSVAKKWPGIDEIRPGNFLFYDLMQEQIGSCRLTDIAVALACPVVALHPDRREAIIYGGGIHLSKDRLRWKGKTIYGRPVLFKSNGWHLPDDHSYVKSLSQEHGIVKCTPALFNKLQIGSLLGILPVHSCMMADLMDGYLTLGGAFWAMMKK